MNEPTSQDDDSRKQRPSEVVTRFLSSFHSGEIADARALLTDDFSFRAPLVDDGSREDFFAGAEAKSAMVRGSRILRQWEDDDDDSTLYEIDVETKAGAASMLMYEMASHPRWLHRLDSDGLRYRRTSC